MDVFLLPVATASDSGYELYCEPPDDPAPAVGEPDPGFIRKLMQRFREMLAAAERERRLAHAGRATETPGQEGMLRAMQRRTMRWVAEAVAEQRLLWNLRGRDQATFLYPEDMQADAARAVLRGTLQHDADRHRRWLIVDSLLLALSGLLILVPGPNVVAYYFAFRVVGHYLSMRGARNALDGVTWTERPSAPLAELRRVPALDAVERVRLVDDVAARLGLEQLPSFFARLAISAR